ncbi:hypothetical protein TRICI_000497 [Trichomonascus ciferrii]|uniref:Tag1 C-terminal domain-containing protein n=1 Tax=Trichomonascus ciferrii TaxID=44093 RepID=A0A642VD83_9ASCO|nr:hypothetical protein TRICI_000497 [Trichomonascus ciferrii]
MSRKIGARDEENAPLLGESSHAAAGPSNNYYSGRIYDPALDEELHQSSRGPGPFARALKLFVPLGVVLALLFLMVTLLRVDELQEEITKVPQVKIEGVSLAGMTTEGLDVRIRGQNTMDYSIVKGSVRSRVVKLGARIVNKLKISDRSRVKVYFENADDEYLRAVNAQIPPIDVNISPGEATDFDFVTKLYNFGSPYLMGSIAEQLLSKEPLKFRGIGQVALSKGFLNLGVFPVEIDEIVASPGGKDDSGDMRLKIGGLNLQNRDKALDISTYVEADYNYPVEAEIPELNWNVNIPGCNDGESLMICRGQTAKTQLIPYSSVNVSVLSNLRTVSEKLKTPCAVGKKSPLDRFISRYFEGKGNNIVITGADHQPEHVPEWLGNTLQGIEFTFEFGGKNKDDEIIKDIAFRDFRLHMFQSNQNPRVSAVVTVTIQTPEQIAIGSDVPLSVLNAKGLANLFSKQHQKFAEINIPDWVKCTTTVKDDNTYLVEFAIKSSPVNVTNEAVFSTVMRQVVFSGSAPVRIESLIDAQVHTPVGIFELTEISANGNTEIKRDQ